MRYNRFFFSFLSPIKSPSSSWPLSNPLHSSTSSITTARQTQKNTDQSFPCWFIQDDRLCWRRTQFVLSVVGILCDPDQSRRRECVGSSILVFFWVSFLTLDYTSFHVQRVIRYENPLLSVQEGLNHHRWLDVTNRNIIFKKDDTKESASTQLNAGRYSVWIQVSMLFDAAS